MQTSTDRRAIPAHRTVAGDEDVLTVAWWHRPDRDIEFTAGRQGQVRMPTGLFIAAMEEFDRDLLAMMDRRIAELERTGPPQGVQIDMHHLRLEQQDRAVWLRRALGRARDTRWSCIRDGASELLVT